MLKVNGRVFSLFTILFPLIFYVTESNGQAILTQSGQAPVVSKFDPDDPPETTIRLAPFLTLGGQVELEYRFERSLDLDGALDEDLSTIEPGLSVAFSIVLGRSFKLFFDVKLSEEYLFEDRDKEDDKVSLQFEQAYLLYKNLLNERLSFQIGRQRLDDDREWLYDKELDAARVFLQLSRLLVELSVSREGLVDRDLLNDDEAERINNYIAYGMYSITEEIYAAAYVLVRDDRSDKEDSPVFFGIHSDGDLTDSLEFWLELAYAWGKDGSNKIRGLGLDLGSIYEFNLPLKPSITFTYAFGAGDGDPDDGVDKGFRQTGLENNEDTFNGVASFKYYGELFDPELINLLIFTAGAGIKLMEESSIDLVYHCYLQDKASDSLREVGIDANPDGRSKKLGSEIDLIIGYEGIENNLELALMLGYFIPGKAFPSESENSFLTRLVIQFEF